MFKVISHGMLVSYGWNSVKCLCCFDLCFIYDTSHYFNVVWFSVCLSLMSFTLLFTNCKTKTLKNLFYLVLFYEIMLACSLVVWEQFLALTSLLHFPGMKLKHTLPGLFIIQLVLRGGQNQKIIKTTFYQTVHSGY